MTREDAPAAKVFAASDKKQIPRERVERCVRFEKGTGNSRRRPVGDRFRGGSGCGDYAEEKQPTNISPQNRDDPPPLAAASNDLDRTVAVLAASYWRSRTSLFRPRRI